MFITGAVTILSSFGYVTMYRLVAASIFYTLTRILLLFVIDKCKLKQTNLLNLTYEIELKQSLPSKFENQVSIFLYGWNDNQAQVLHQTHIMIPTYHTHIMIPPYHTHILIPTYHMHIMIPTDHTNLLACEVNYKYNKNVSLIINITNQAVLDCTCTIYNAQHKKSLGNTVLRQKVMTRAR